MDLIYILVHLIIRWQQGGSRKEDERRTEGDPASTVPLLPHFTGPEHRGRSEMGPGDKVMDMTNQVLCPARSCSTVTWGEQQAAVSEWLCGPYWG